MWESVSVPQKRHLIFLTILLALLLPLFWWVVSPFIAPFLISMVLAIVLYPISKRVSRRTGRPAFAAAITTLGTMIVLGGLSVAATVALTGEVTEAYAALNRLSVQEGGWPALVSHTTDRVLEQIERRVPIDRAAIQNELINRLKTLSGTILKWTGSMLAEITSGFFNGILATIFLYFMLIHGVDWIESLISVVPLEPRTTRSLIRTVHDSIVANVNGVLAVALSQAIMLSIGFSVAGIRSPVLWGSIGGLASVIPLVGGMIIWVPIIVGLAITGAYLKAILLALWCGIVVGSADNLVRPWVVAGTVQQHPLLIALAMFGGTAAFGTAGVLFGPVILSLVIAVWTELNKATQAQQPGLMANRQSV
jgi:predicted PurR-regulated permease PerM